jgi:serine/threonine protein kinase
MKLRDFQDAFRFVDWSEKSQIWWGRLFNIYSGVYRPMAGLPVDVVVHHRRSDLFSPDDFQNTLGVIEMMASLNHPVCIPLVACNLDPHHSSSFVTPRMIGSLAKVCEQMRCRPDFFNDTFKSIVSFGIASALSYLHSRRIVHGKLTPSNILLDANFRPRLCGFSLSRNLNDPGADLVSEYVTNPHYDDLHSGVTPYVAPELLDGDEYDERVDVFAYAGVLYDLLTDGNSSMRLLSFRETHKLRSELRWCELPGLNANYRELITKCWSKLPGDRPSFRSILDRPDLLMLESCDRDAFAKYQNELALF